MKILIKESQYNLLLEQNNPNIVKAYNEIIKGAKFPLGTRKDAILKAFDYIKNSSDFKTLLLMFKDKKTGYSSFEEMINEEYDRFDFKDIIKLQEKLYSIGVILEFRTGTNTTGHLLYFNGPVKITYDTNFKNNKNSIRVNSDCTSKYPPLLKQAQDYWRKWLSSPITKQKFRTNWNVQPKNDTVDGKKVDDIFEEYIDCIDSLKLVFYDNTMIHPPGYGEINLSKAKTALAFVSDITPENVYVNCSFNDDDGLGTMIHEIQHLLYDIKPLNPSIDISNVFIKPGDKKMGPKDVLGTSKTTNLMINIKNIEINGKILNLQAYDIASWGIRANNKIKTRLKNNNDPGYICRQTEKASNIQSIRNLFGIKPGQNITPEMLKPYIKGEKEHTDVHWLLLCWASNGFKDIRLFLADINKLAFQDTKPTDNTRLV
jgi:hypothetical protein